MCAGGGLGVRGRRGGYVQAEECVRAEGCVRVEGWVYVGRGVVGAAGPRTLCGRHLGSGWWKGSV